jgi:hypothetical protein
MFADVLNAACKLYAVFPLLVLLVVFDEGGRRGRSVSTIVTIESDRGPVCCRVTISSGGSEFFKE